MAMTHSVKVQVGRIYSPLTLSPGVTVEGNVPGSQQYDIAANAYYPDYTQTGLVLRPSLTVSDPDGIIPEGDVQMANISWTLLDGTSSTAITTATPGFTVQTDGKLLVQRNCAGQTPMTLRFEGQYLDPRTGKVYKAVESHTVICEGISERPVIRLDTSGVIPYDPLRDGEKTRKVKASLTIGGKEVPAANREFVWQKRDCDIDSQWADITLDSDPNHDIMDYDVSLSADRTELTVRLWLIGKRIDIRCYARYNPFGSPSAVTVDARTPVETFTCSRVKRRLWGTYIGPTLFRSGVRQFSPRLAVRDALGVLADPDAVVDIQWRNATCNASGTLTQGAVVAYGSRPTISTSFMDGRYGGKLMPEFDVKNPYGALLVKDSDGVSHVLVDGGGGVILARERNQ